MGPVLEHSTGDVILGRQVYTLGRLTRGKQAKHGKLTTNCLTRAGGGTHQHIVIRLKQGVERLCLDWIEVQDWSDAACRIRKQFLESWVNTLPTQHPHRQRLQVQQLGARRVLGGQDQMAKRDSGDHF